MAFTPTHNPNGPSEWSGDSKQLPPMGEVFIYKNNAYYWIPCTCSNQCKRPLVFTENGVKSYNLTLKARGENIGMIEVEILELLGYSREVIVDILDNGDIEQIKKLIDAKMNIDPDGTSQIIAEFFERKLRDALGNVLSDVNLSLGLSGFPGPIFSSDPDQDIPPFSNN